MELIILGAGPAYSNRPGALGAAYLVRLGDAALLLDLGQGAFSNLAATMEPSALLAVAISHLHPDHFIDLVPLRHYLRYDFSPPRRVRVLGPRHLAERIDALHAEPGFSAESLDVEALGEGTLRIGPFDLEARCVAHTDESYAFRVSVAGEGGPGVVYSGDCGDAEDLAPLIRPDDVLLTEISFGPGPVPAGVRHLDVPAVVGLARRTRPGRVLLTHLLPAYQVTDTEAAVRAGYAGPVAFVSPGDRIPID